MLPSREAYARWAASYPPYPHNALMEIEQAAMLRLLPDVQGRDVLDLACGTGRYGKIAMERGARRVVGVDDSFAMLRAGVVAPRAEGTMDRLPLSAACVDVVLCGMALGHLSAEALRRTFAEVARVLRPGGEFLFSDFHPYLALHGGQRTFTDQYGATFAVEHRINFISDYFALGRDFSMILMSIEEPQTMIRKRQVPAVVVMRFHNST